MDQWIEKEGYDTCLQANDETLNAAGTEVHLIRFREGKFCHYHQETTEFFYFTSGSGRVLLDGEQQRLFPGVSIIIKPYVVHTFINDSRERYMEAVMIKTNVHGGDTYPV